VIDIGAPSLSDNQFSPSRGAVFVGQVEANAPGLVAAARRAVNRVDVAL